MRRNETEFWERQSIAGALYSKATMATKTTVEGVLGIYSFVQKGQNNKK